MITMAVKGRLLVILCGILLGGCLAYLYSSQAYFQTGQEVDKAGQQEAIPREVANMEAPPPAAAQKTEGSKTSSNDLAPVFGDNLPAVQDTLEKSPFGNGWSEKPALTNVRSYGVVDNIPDDQTLAGYDISRLSAIYHSFLDNSDIRCHRKLRMGQVGNCGWEVCDDYEWRPIRPCIIYSFGINYEFSFDDDAGQIYGCDVYSFDPSMSKQATYRRSDRVMFYRLGIGARSGPAQKLNNGWVLHSLSNFRQMLNHTHTILDVLKMDVENAEWSSLVTMLRERQLNSVRQLLVEYHMTSDNADTLRAHLKILREVERVGFRKFYITKNPACARPAVGVPIKRTSCYEVHYVNARLLRKTPV